MKLPVIDFHDNMAGHDIADSLNWFGFAVLKNHHLDPDLIKGMYSSWRHWFEQTPTDAKRTYLRNPKTQAGYFSLEEAESAADSDTKDHKEYFHIFWHDPIIPEELIYITKQYFHQAHAFSARVMSMIAAECPGSKDWEDRRPWFNGDQHLLRVLYYPSIPLGERDWNARAHEHTDVNLLTVLPSGTTAGLQVKKQGNWWDVPSGDNYLILNGGDALAELTGNYYRSALHRVRIDPARDMEPRMSLPFFLHARTDARLSDKWIAGDFLQDRLKRLGVEIQ